MLLRGKKIVMTFHDDFPALLELYRAIA